MTALDDYLVCHRPEQIEDIKVHERPNGTAGIETVAYRPIRVYERQAGGFLLELHGEDKDNALAAFWADVERFNNGEIEL
ncbi:hypothetical protein ACU639_27125 [Streptomyces cynarae]|uniref:hypothetical protein n=1 Tax=Streptomyces cynarae TaxID=2981134 RepID=UPI00406D3285